jgi:hippurate hydrolase
MVTALQTFITRSFDPFDPVVLTVGSFHAGTATNVIPDQARFGATVRSFSRAAHGRVKDGVERVCRGIAAAHGLEVEVDFVEEYPVTVNDAAEAEFVADVVADLHGEQRYAWAPEPITGSEDFSRVLAEVPGAFVFLGACPPDRDPQRTPFNHSPLAVFDDAVLGDGAALYAELAMRRLGAEGVPTL